MSQPLDTRLAAADRALIRQITIESHAQRLLAQLHPDEYETIKAHLEQAASIEFTTLNDIRGITSSKEQA